MRKALVVLSGGQDSTTALFWAKEHFEEVHAITFNYGQLHIIEVNAAMKVAKMAGVASHEIIHVPHCLVSTSPLITHTDLERYADHREMERIIGGRVEKTFVPMRNAFFFVIAMNHAVALGSYDLVTGVCQEDNANYPDCTETFVNRFISMTNASMGAATNEFYIHAPLMHLTKAETVRMSAGMPECWKALAYTHTSYDGIYPPNDHNHANILRAQGFLEAGFPDPLVVRAWKEGLMELPISDNYAILLNQSPKG